MTRHMAPWRVVFESFPCPTCGAGPGEHCMTSNGNVRNETHVDRGRDAMRCPKCGGRLAFDAEPGDLCGRCEQVRALEVERATYHRRKNPW
jgi:ribosomal protein S27AE